MENKRRRICTFTDVHVANYPFLLEGRKQTEAFCSVCDTYFDFGIGGVEDIVKHMKTTKHSTKMPKAVIQTRMQTVLRDNHCPPAEQPTASTSTATKQSTNVVVSTEDNKLTAELTLAYHAVKHLQSYSAMDCTTGLIKQLLSDSVTASQIVCDRAKTEHLINNVISKHILTVVLDKLKSDSVRFFGMYASRHNNRMFPIVIQYFDFLNGGINIKIIDFYTITNTTGPLITNYIRTLMEKHGLSRKLVSFTSDSVNLDYGGFRRNEENQDIHYLLKRELRKPLFGLTCPGQVLNNCIKYGADSLENVDIESAVMKIYNYFSVYSIRNEKLTSFCNDADKEHHRLLSSSQSRWLNLFSAIEKMLTSYHDLKEFFASETNAPKTIKQFFENKYSEVYLYFILSLKTIFQPRVSELEREDITVIDVFQVLKTTSTSLRLRFEQNFFSLGVTRLLNILGEDPEKNVRQEMRVMYGNCIQYLQMWTAKFEEFSCFTWVKLGKNMTDFANIVESLNYCQEKLVDIDDVKLFDEYQDLKEFCANQNSVFFSQALTMQWITFLFTNKRLCTELNKICQYLFGMFVQNNSVNRAFSLINSQSHKEKYNLSIETKRAIAVILVNSKNMNCENFHAYITTQKDLLRTIGAASEQPH